MVNHFNAYNFIVHEHTSYQSLPPLPAVAYLFQAGVPFSRENAKWTVFRKIYSEKKTQIYTFFVMKLLEAPSQILNVINNKVRQTKYQVRQTKHQVRNFNQKSTPKKQILTYAVLSRCNFCREFTHFFGIPFTGLKNMVAYQK